MIGSAFEFNREIDRLVWANKTYGAVSEDMESAFAAGAAVGFGVRFVAVRIISDSEFHSPEFQQIAGEYCAAFVVEVVKTTANVVRAAPPASGGHYGIVIMEAGVGQYLPTPEESHT